MEWNVFILIIVWIANDRKEMNGNNFCLDRKEQKGK